MREHLAVGELLGGLALARRGGCEAVEHALGIGVGAAREQAEAVEPGRQIVEQQPGARTLGGTRLGRGVLSAPATDERGS
jgi:hypothetical protein